MLLAALGIADAVLMQENISWSSEVDDVGIDIQYLRLQESVSMLELHFLGSRGLASWGPICTSACQCTLGVPARSLLFLVRPVQCIHTHLLSGHCTFNIKSSFSENQHLTGAVELAAIPRVSVSL